MQPFTSSLSFSRVDPPSLCTSSRPTAVLVHECCVRSPPGVSAERNPDNQRCLPLKTPAAAFLPRGWWDAGRVPPPKVTSDPQTQHQKSRPPEGTRTSNYAAKPRGRIEKGLHGKERKSSAVIKAQQGQSCRKETAAVH